MMMIDDGDAYISITVLNVFVVEKKLVIFIRHSLLGLNLFCTWAYYVPTFLRVTIRTN